MTINYGLTPAQLCQQIADNHGSIAFSDDHRISSGHLPLYRNSQRLFISAIRMAYGLTALKAQRVYDIWSDCQENIDYCVTYVKTNRESRAYSR
jgi:hypothetical protein